MQGRGRGGVGGIFCSVSGVESMIMSWQLWPPGCQTDPSTPFGGHSWSFKAPMSSCGLENSFTANTWRLFFSKPLGQRYRSCFSRNVCDEHFESAGWEVTPCLYCIDACRLSSSDFCQPPTFPGFVTKEGHLVMPSWCVAPKVVIGIYRLDLLFLLVLVFK